jgi:hypothetical protein
VYESVDLFQVLLDDRLVMVRATPADFTKAYEALRGHAHGSSSPSGAAAGLRNDALVVAVARRVAHRFCTDNRLTDGDGGQCVANLEQRIRQGGKLH